MPELPDLQVYVDALQERIEGATLESVRLKSLFVLRSVDPPIAVCEGRRVLGIERIGKRLILALQGELFLVVHLMIAGRLQWKSERTEPQGRIGLLAMQFSTGTLLLNEAGKKKRASLHVVEGRDSLRDHDRGGLEIFEASLEEFIDAMTTEVHTLKRALTDPRILAGIGNAYSDEILWHASMSPFRRTDKLKAKEWRRLYASCTTVLADWVDRLRSQARSAKGASKWPRKVTAFHEGMAVHGKHRQPCPRCGDEVQRVVWAENESNYCARCQTGGKLLADRVLSRLLRTDWPRSLEELEALRAKHRGIMESGATDDEDDEGDDDADRDGA